MDKREVVTEAEAFKIAWRSWDSAKRDVLTAMIWAKNYGGVGLSAAKGKTPGGEAIRDARFGLAVFVRENGVAVFHGENEEES